MANDLASFLADESAIYWSIILTLMWSLRTSRKSCLFCLIC